MNIVPSFNSFRNFEHVVRTAETEISCLGTRYIVLNMQNERMQKVKISLPTFFEICDKISKNTLDIDENKAGKRILTYLNETILFKFDTELKKNCFKRFIVAIRDFFRCFFKSLTRQIKNFDAKLDSLNPKAASTSSSSQPITTITTKPGPNRFQNMDNIMTYKLKPFLDPASYGALSRANKSTNRLLQTLGHVSFNARHCKTAYNIKMKEFKNYEFNLRDLGIKPYPGDTGLYSLSSDCIISKDHDSFMISQGNLLKIDHHSKPPKYLRKQFVPKEAFSPPKEKDVELKGQTIHKINEKYFYIQYPQLQMSVWTFDTLQCVYATECRPRHWLKEIDTYIHDQTLISWSRPTDITSLRRLSVYKKDLENLDVPVISYQINFPVIFQLSELCGYPAGLLYSPGDRIILYDWNTGGELYHMDCVTSGIRFSVIVKNYLVFQEVYTDGERQLPGKLQVVNLHTQETRTLVFPTELGLLDKYLDVTVNEKFVVLPNNTRRSFYVINIETGAVVTTIDVPYLISYFLTKRGDLVVRTYDNRVIIYQPLTNAILMELPVCCGLLLERDNFLIINRGDGVIFIDLDSYRVLSKIEMRDQNIHHFENGRMVTSNATGLNRFELVHVYDFVPPAIAQAESKLETVA